MEIPRDARELNITHDLSRGGVSPELSYGILRAGLSHEWVERYGFEFSDCKIRISKSRAGVVIDIVSLPDRIIPYIEMGRSDNRLVLGSSLDFNIQAASGSGDLSVTLEGKDYEYIKIGFLLSPTNFPKAQGYTFLSGCVSWNQFIENYKPARLEIICSKEGNIFKIIRTITYR